ncbi:MAG: hypothetical protein LUP93_00310, partial [Methanomicrobiales archaeon]|nr:hypothetical protein [Methanomicrobiales archaeon]
PVPRDLRVMQDLRDFRVKPEPQVRPVPRDLRVMQDLRARKATRVTPATLGPWDLLDLRDCKGS